MLSDAVKTRYQQTLAQCEYTLARHPAQTMAQKLQAIMPLAEQYAAQDVYGQGKLINEFEQDVARLLGQEAAIFMPSGTMAQAMALRIWADAKQCRQVAFHPTSHLQLHEHLAYQQLHALEATLVGAADAAISSMDLHALKQPLAALLLELPMREIGGQLPSWDDLLAQAQWAKAHNVALHMDGARVWCCSSYYQRSLAEIGGLFDSVYVSFYKDMGGIAGAMLAGSTAFIAQARIWCRRCGGNIFTQFPEVLAAKAGLEKHLPAMAEYVRKAGLLSECFRQQAGIEVIPHHTQGNLFHLLINQPAETLMPKVDTWSRQHRVAILPLPRTMTRDSCRFEITIGENALAQSDLAWQQAITRFAAFIQ
ncbi:threonine aldolase family protein [Shewanella sp. YIC-542]|uniref:threonine aldolase family protein n=1 Tax=Shewanella mytili TaxID=3377111 RepID=UPI00398F01EF